MTHDLPTGAADVQVGTLADVSLASLNAWITQRA